MYDLQTNIFVHTQYIIPTKYNMQVNVNTQTMHMQQYKCMQATKKIKSK